MKKTVYIFLGIVLIAGFSFFSGCDELQGDSEELLTQAWNSFKTGDFETAIDFFQKAKAKATGDELLISNYGLGWSFFRTNQSGFALNTLDSLYAKYPEAIVPLSFLRLNQELNTGTSDSLTQVKYVTAVARMKTFLSANPAYVFQYETTIDYKDVALNGAQISFHRKKYSEAVNFIKFIEPEFDPGTAGTQDYINAILSKIDALRIANS